MSEDSSAGLAPASAVVHLGRPPAAPGEPIQPPLVLSSTYHRGGAAAYARDANPTWTALEETVGALEGGQAVAFASGHGAIASVFEMLPVPGRVVCAGDSYNGTRLLLADLAGRGRLRYRSVDVADTASTLSACADLAAAPGRPSGAEGGFGDGGLLWLESPTNPLLAVADVPALVEGAHSLGLHVAVDNTFATPLLQRPLLAGADIVVHSATKSLSGHSDVLLGVAVASDPSLAAAIARRRSLHGAVPGPLEAWLALRGMRTLAVRVERAQANAGEIARRLAGHPSVRSVRYPGLEGDPGHERATRLLDGYGTMLSFEVDGGADRAEAVEGALRLITAATSLGGVESLIERRGRWKGEEALPPGLLRLSVGIEDVEDLWRDLDSALHATRTVGG